VADEPALICIKEPGSIWFDNMCLCWRLPARPEPVMDAERMREIEQIIRAADADILADDQPG